jgi:hypothetical protein
MMAVSSSVTLNAAPKGFRRPLTPETIPEQWLCTTTLYRFSW